MSTGSPHEDIELDDQTGSSTLVEEAAEPDAPSLPQIVERKPQLYLDFFLAIAAFPLAIIVGCAIVAGSTYCLVHGIQVQAADAAVYNDPNNWLQEARAKIYDPCYLGCDDCSDPAFAYNACEKTLEVNGGPGVVCHGNLIWNWEDRYPVACLLAIGETIKGESLEYTISGHKNMYMLIPVIVICGILGGGAICCLCLTLTKKRRMRYKDQAQHHGSSWPGRWTQQTQQNSHANMNGYANSNANRNANANSGWKRFFTCAAIASLCGRTHANAPHIDTNPTRAVNRSTFACTGYAATVDEYFTNADHSISGVVHGWLAKCYAYDCDCHETCHYSEAIKTNARPANCAEHCSTCTGTLRTPQDYVKDVVPQIQGCGFYLTNHVNDLPGLRVANAGIERNWWVRIGVNGYNISHPDKTDRSIWCLHSIGDRHSAL
jgi:hypothetical protein